MSDELKACGSCGRGSYVEDDGDYYHAGCDECGLRMGGFDTRADAIAAWNRRVVTREHVEMMANIARATYPEFGLVAAANFMRTALRCAGFEVAE